MLLEGLIIVGIVGAASATITAAGCALGAALDMMDNINPSKFHSRHYWAEEMSLITVGDIITEINVKLAADSKKTTGTKDRVINVIASLFGREIDTITEATLIVNDLGADELESEELCLNLAEEFNIDINDDDIERMFLKKKPKRPRQKKDPTQTL